MNAIEHLYADYELEGNDMFVITPEGNKFSFNGDEYNEEHENELIIDPDSHKQYIVIFNE